VSETVPTSTTAPLPPEEPGASAVPSPPIVIPHAPTSRGESNAKLLRVLWLLAWPVLAEQVLHMMVGLNDTYLANHVAPERHTTAAASAAVGTVSYFLWLVGLLTGAVGTGSTAIIARATGARHRRLANSICGQSVGAGALAGAVMGAVMFAFAEQIATVTGLRDQAREFALQYIRMLSFSLPFLTTMFVANACLRGAGDTLTPAVTFVVVDVVNMLFSWGLTYGMFGLPRWGFAGIAMGTVIAYVAGGVIQFVVLLRGRGGIRLYLHRLQPHWHNLKRLLRIGVPSGLEGLLQWGVNFALVVVINGMDRTFVSAAAHNNAIKIESLSYLAGFAFATAAATLVGQSLGMRDPLRARRCAYLAYFLGGGIMTLVGLSFVVAGRFPSILMSDDPVVRDLTTRCLFISGFSQCGFAAQMIFGGALRGAGDTLMVMLLNLASLFVVRLTGVLIVGWWLKMGLTAVWVVLACELMVRGALVYGRFARGEWRKIEV
jgi:putative MATE family efflux protein